MTVTPSPGVSPPRTFAPIWETSTVSARPSSARNFIVEPSMLSILPWIRCHSPDGAFVEGAVAAGAVAAGAVAAGAVAAGAVAAGAVAAGAFAAGAVVAGAVAGAAAAAYRES